MLAFIVQPGAVVKVKTRGHAPDSKDAWATFRETKERMFFREDIVGDPSDRLSQADFARFGRLGYYVFNLEDEDRFDSYMVHSSRVVVG